jgi:hypothetical protein
MWEISSVSLSKLLRARPLASDVGIEFMGGYLEGSLIDRLALRNTSLPARSGGSRMFWKLKAEHEDLKPGSVHLSVCAAFTTTSTVMRAVEDYLNGEQGP